MPVSTNYQATYFERIPYDGGNFTIYAPTGPVAGDQWGVKNISGGVTVYISGNNSIIENPQASGYSLVATFIANTIGLGVTWEYINGSWYAVEKGGI
jgi:hypothetical protein